MTTVKLETFQSQAATPSVATSNIIGVYSVTCSITGKCYIGSSTNVHSRLTWHKSHLRNGKHSRREMQNDFIAHGAENFTFEVLLICADEHEAIREEAVRIGESFKAGLSYNGIIPNAIEAKPRAKKAPADAQRRPTHNEELKRHYEALKERIASEKHGVREIVHDVMWYLSFRNELQFFRMIDAFLKLTGTTDDALSLVVTGYPKFLFALRRRPEAGSLTVSNGQKFHDHILHFMEDRDRAYMFEERAARKAWINSERAAA